MHFYAVIILSIISILFQGFQATHAVQEVQQATGSLGDIGLLEIAFATNSFPVILFIIWYFTFKYATKRSQKNASERQEQFLSVLEQNKQQFKMMIDQSAIQYQEAMKSSRDTMNRIYSVQQEHVKYVSMLNEAMAQVNTKQDLLIKHVERSLEKHSDQNDKLISVLNKIDGRLDK